MSDLELQQDLWQEEICREFAEWSFISIESWLTPFDLFPDDQEDLPSYWYSPLPWEEDFQE